MSSTTPLFNASALAFIKKYNKLYSKATSATTSPSRRAVDKHQNIENEFMVLLNKLTDINYDKLFLKIRTLINNSKTLPTVEYIVREVYNKALYDTKYHQQYMMLLKNIWELPAFSANDAKTAILEILRQYHVKRHDYIARSNVSDADFSTAFCVKRYYLTIMELFGILYNMKEVNDEYIIQLMNDLTTKTPRPEEIDMITALVKIIRDEASATVCGYIIGRMNTINETTVYSKRTAFAITDIIDMISGGEVVQCIDDILKDEDDINNFVCSISNENATNGFKLISDDLYEDLYNILFMRLIESKKNQERMFPFLKWLYQSGKISNYNITEQLAAISENLEDLKIDIPNVAMNFIPLRNFIKQFMS